MTEFVIIRHGPTRWNAERRIQGHSDTPLSEKGRSVVQQWRLPAHLRQWRWYCSPLARARDTATLLGLDACYLEAALMEMNWGAWEGKRIVDLRAQDPTGFAAKEALGLDFERPGGESPRQVQARLRPLLRRIARSGQPAGAVSHRGVIRALYCLATGWDLRGEPPAAIDNGCLHRFDLSKEGLVRLIRLNEPLAP